MHTKSLFTLALGLLVAGTAWASNPESFIYQGRLTDLNGNPSTGMVALRFQILNPNKSCLLYEETQSLDLTATQGLFTMAVGSPVGSAKRTVNDSGLSMTAIFSNGAQAFGVSTPCPSGYTPSSGDGRYMRVTVTPALGTADTLAPDQYIGSVPFATTATTLQGKQPGDFIQTDTSVGMSLDQSSVNQVFEATAFTKLITFLKATGATSMSNQKVTDVATPTAATDAVNKDYADKKLAGFAIDPALALSSGQILTYNSGLNRWEGTTLPTLPTHATGSATACAINQASRWDGSAWVCIGVDGGGGVGTLAGDNTAQVLTSSSDKVQMVNITTAGSIQLPDATTYADTGGPKFHFLNANSIDVPVLDSTGKLVGSVPSSSGIDIYLFDRATAGGKWLMNGSSFTSSFTQKKVSVAATGSLLAESSSGQFFGVSATSGLYLYHFDAGSGNHEYRVALITFSGLGFSFGAPLTLFTRTDINMYYVSMAVLSDSKVVMKLNINSDHRIVGLSISAPTVALAGDLDGNSCGYGQLIASGDFAYCTDNSVTNKFDFSGGTLVASGAVTVGGQPFWFAKIGTADVIGACDTGGLVVRKATFGGATSNDFTVPSTSNCSSAGASVAGGRSVLAADASSIWMLIGNPARKVRINWDGTGFSAPNAVSNLPADFSMGAVFLSVGGQTYLVSGTGTTLKRSRVSNALTMAMDPSERASDCNGVRTDINRCVSFSATSGAVEGLFQVGY